MDTLKTPRLSFDSTHPAAFTLAALGILLAAGISPLFAQGMISSGAAAMPKAKASGRPWPVSFVDAAAEAGLRFSYTYGDPLKKQFVIEANGSGAGMLDYDGDGRMDLFLVDGSRLKNPPAAPVPSNRLYRNLGGGRFEDVTDKAGVGRSGWGNGICGGDVDNDGRPDVYVTYYGKNSLYVNGGTGFTDAAEKAGVAGNGSDWSTGCSFIDYDRDGRLDLLVTSYLRFDIASTPAPGSHPFCFWKGKPVYCGPRGLPFGRLTLYRNRGNGTFEDVSERSGIRAPKNHYAFTALTADLTGDGWPDLYVACDSTPSIFFRNNRDGTFTDVGVEAGLAFNENGAEQAGMGLAAGDFDRDGRLDITKTNFIGDYPNLYRNLGRGIFEDIAVKAGLAVNPDHVLWGVGMEDLDNDGFRDLFQVTGHVYPEVGAIDPRETYKSRRLVYRNLGNGRFEDVSDLSGSGIAQLRSSRGAAFGDFDNDGDVDVVVMNMHEAPSILRNDLKSANHWVKLKLEGTRSNRAAIGACVTVYTGDRHEVIPVLSQSSFLSLNDPRLHAGLGAAGQADRIVVRWPGGDTEEFPAAAAQGLYLLKEGSGRTERLPLPQ
jgi:hypothetical protein